MNPPPEVLTRAVLAAHGALGPTRTAAVLFDSDGVILSVGVCRRLRRGSVHAEQAALEACINPAGADILVVTINPLREGLAMAKPCARCWRALVHAGVRTAWWSGWNGRIESAPLT